MLCIVLAASAICARTEARAQPPRSDSKGEAHAVARQAAYPTFALGIAFDYHVPDPVSLGRQVGYVWGASEPTLPGAMADAYMPFSRDPLDPGRGHTLAWWQANHPDWIAYQCDGVTPAYLFGDGNVPLDISNPAVREYQLEFATAQLARGYGGIAFDNLMLVNTGGACGVYRNGAFTALDYSDDRAYAREVATWAAQLRAALKARAPSARFDMNLSTGPGVDLSQFVDLAASADLVYDEAGVTDLGRHRVTGVAWKREISFLAALAARGQSYVMNGLTSAKSDSAVSRRDVQWVLANYLLVKAPGAFVYVYPSDRSYGSFYDRAEYHASIGVPTAPMQSTHGIYLRCFSRGLTAVNPSTKRSAVRLGHAYADLYGRRVRGLTLRPAEGTILKVLDPGRLTKPGARPAPRARRSASGLCELSRGQQRLAGARSKA